MGQQSIAEARCVVLQVAAKILQIWRIEQSDGIHIQETDGQR